MCVGEGGWGGGGGVCKEILNAATPHQALYETLTMYCILLNLCCVKKQKRRGGERLK